MVRHRKRLIIEHNEKVAAGERGGFRFAFEFQKRRTANYEDEQYTLPL